MLNTLLKFIVLDQTNESTAFQWPRWQFSTIHDDDYDDDEQVDVCKLKGVVADQCNNNIVWIDPCMNKDIIFQNR